MADSLPVEKLDEPTSRFLSNKPLETEEKETLLSRLLGYDIHSRYAADPVKRLNSVQELRRWPKESLRNGDQFIVAYHSTQNDLGGGVFVWDTNYNYQWPPIGDNFEIHSGSREGDNDGTVIRPDSVLPSEKGRWRRLESLTKGSDLMRPEWFGSRSNDSSFDSLPAIQRAHDCLPLFMLGAGQSPSGRGIRVGSVSVGAGEWRIDDTLYMSIGAQLKGVNKNATSIKAGNNKFDDGTEIERFMVKWERPEGTPLNHLLRCSVEDISLYGNASFYGNNNSSISGISIFGGNGSWGNNIIVTDVAKRGVNTDIPFYGDNIIGNVREGPCLDFQSTQSVSFGIFSIGVCNSNNTTDAQTNLPIASMRLKDCSDVKFDRLEFDTSPVGISMHDVQKADFGKIRFISRVQTTDTYSVYIQGNSQDIVFRDEFLYPYRQHAYKIFDNSEAAKNRGVEGERSSYYFGETITASRKNDNEFLGQQKAPNQEATTPDSLLTRKLADERFGYKLFFIKFLPGNSTKLVYLSQNEFSQRLQLSEPITNLSGVWNLYLLAKDQDNRIFYEKRIAGIIFDSVKFNENTYIGSAVEQLYTSYLSININYITLNNGNIEISVTNSEESLIYLEIIATPLK